MKELNVKKISSAAPAAESVPALLDEAGVAFQPLDAVNWEEYPYRPEVEFRLAHTGDALLLHYRVKEASVRAVAGEDNGRVWEDACVEFFSSPEADGTYYNIECNCIGTVLVGGGAPGNRGHAPQEVLDRVQRWSSLGRAPFEERVGECRWEVALVVPSSTYYLHNVASLDGRTMRANFYKCGDLLQTPHFLSWNPIRLEKPNFHCPDFFGTLHLEG